MASSVSQSPGLSQVTWRMHRWRRQGHLLQRLGALEEGRELPLTHGAESGSAAVSHLFVEPVGGWEALPRTVGSGNGEQR